MKHLPEQYRIFSGILANTYKEEAIFNFVNSISTVYGNHPSTYTFTFFSLNRNAMT